MGNIFVESFINGREFTVFILGSAQEPESIKIYPPLEFLFNSSLPDFKKFKSHKIILMGKIFVGTIS